MKALALTYRPTTFDDVVEQGSTITILKNQIETNTFKHAYLFAGSAGCGKTTCARIFANEINNHQGNPIEMDAASNNSVEDVRNIIQQAKSKSLDSEYKVFIIDECHSISSTGWQAMLKLIEEPPAKSIFIFCTTDPQKIPKTILSRVQRYDFTKISYASIVDRLKYICKSENIDFEIEALEYIAKLADGGMRDSITMLDKCVSYAESVSVDNVVKALGVADYETMFAVCDSFVYADTEKLINRIEKVYNSGADLKQFVKQLLSFCLDISKYKFTKSFEFINLPETEENKSILSEFTDYDFEGYSKMLKILVKLNADIKWETNPKTLVEAVLLSEVE